MMNQRIVIVGFMACGKTTVGRELARQLNCDFVDLDSFINEVHGRSPAEIIEQDGEESFRKIETLALRDVLQNQETAVVALGGGAWTIPANRTLIAQHNYSSVWLDAPFDLCWQRINRAATVRPLAPNRAAAQTRYDDRRPHYALARRIAINESSTPQMLAEEILKEF